MKIVVALDLSPQAPKVLEQALELAKWKNAECILITVVEEAFTFAEGLPLALIDRLKEDANKALEEYARTAKAQGVAVRAVLEQGHSPADSILVCAEEEKADLIVTGSRAKTGLDRFLIGSVAAKVTSYAPCSVLVVR